VLSVTTNVVPALEILILAQPAPIQPELTAIRVPVKPVSMKQVLLCVNSAIPNVSRVLEMLIIVQCVLV